MVISKWHFQSGSGAFVVYINLYSIRSQFLYTFKKKKVPFHQVSVCATAMPHIMFCSTLPSQPRGKKAKIFDVGPRAVNNNEIRYLNASCIMEWKHHEHNHPFRIYYERFYLVYFIHLCWLSIFSIQHGACHAIHLDKHSTWL